MGWGWFKRNPKIGSWGPLSEEACACLGLEAFIAMVEVQCRTAAECDEWHFWHRMPPGPGLTLQFKLEFLQHDDHEIGALQYKVIGLHEDGLEDEASGEPFPFPIYSDKATMYLAIYLVTDGHAYISKFRFRKGEEVPRVHDPYTTMVMGRQGVVGQEELESYADSMFRPGLSVLPRQLPAGFRYDTTGMRPTFHVERVGEVWHVMQFWIDDATARLRYRRQIIPSSGVATPTYDINST